MLIEVNHKPSKTLCDYSIFLLQMTASVREVPLPATFAAIAVPMLTAEALPELTLLFEGACSF